MPFETIDAHCRQPLSKKCGFAGLWRFDGVIKNKRIIVDWVRWLSIKYIIKVLRI
jgi:hypothetical protein